MSGFKIGDEVVIVNRDRGGKVQGGQESRDGGMFYFVRFDDGQVLIYRENELGLKSDFAKDNQLATLRCVRDLLLSDEFIDALVERMNEKLFVTEVRSVTFGTVDIPNADNNLGVAKCQIQ